MVPPISGCRHLGSHETSQDFGAAILNLVGFHESQDGIAQLNQEAEGAPGPQGLGATEDTTPNLT